MPAPVATAVRVLAAETYHVLHELNTLRHEQQPSTPPPAARAAAQNAQSQPNGNSEFYIAAKEDTALHNYKPGSEGNIKVLGRPGTPAEGQEYILRPNSDGTVSPETDRDLQGTYNYYDPSIGPAHAVGHFVYDVLPWMLFGVGPEDDFLGAPERFAEVAKGGWNKYLQPFIDDPQKFLDDLPLLPLPLPTPLGWIPGMAGVIGDIGDLFGEAEQTRSPIVLDLDGDGIETLGIGAGVYFDHDGNGFAELSGWVAGDDGLLVFDRNGNGQIDDGSELFGNQTGTANGNADNGFVALRGIDSNSNGVIDSADADFAKLRVWRDTNHNGATDTGEFLTLQAAGVASLSLAFGEGATVDSNGNEHRQTGAYTTVGGQSRAMTDVWFAVDTAKTIDKNVVDIPAEVAALPDILGSGNVASLRQAIARDSSGLLKAAVSQFIAEPNEAARATLLLDVVYRWAGVYDVAPDSRAATQIYGNVIGDARKLASLEAFLGDDYVGVWCWGELDANPHGPAARILLQAFDMLASYVGTQIDAQTRFADLYAGIDVNWNATTARLEIDVLGLVSMMEVRFAEFGEAQGLADLAKFAASLGTAGTFGQEVLDLLRAQGDDSGEGFSLYLATMGLASSVGDDLGNSLSGDEGADVLLGFGGSDSLYGNAGNDRLVGGTGDDHLSGDSGADTYVFHRGDGRDTINNWDDDAVGSAPDVLEFGAGIGPSDVLVRRDYYDLILRIAGTSDEVRISSFIDQAGLTPYAIDFIKFADGTVWTAAQLMELMSRPTPDDDYIIGRNVADTIDALAGNDVVEGLGGNDTLKGGSGNDWLYGGTGNDSIDGGTEGDYLYGDAGADTLKGGSGEDYLQGDAGNDTLDGGADADTLAGGEDNDTLKGGDGEDYLYGEAGNDSLNGGTGTDTLDGGAGSDTYRFEAGWGHDTINNFSWLRQAGDQDIIVFATGIAQADISARRDGQDLLLLHANGTDKVTVSGYFYGTDYRLHEVRFANGTIWTHDTIRALVAIGTDEDETLQGDDGVDVLDGKGGADSLYGGGGGDTLKGGSGEDYLQGDAGNDTLDGGADADTLAGGEDNDTLKGGDGEDYLYGEAGNDSLNGGTGTDTLDGGAGSDTYRFEAGWGHDTINNFSWLRQAGDQDIIVFATGIAQADISARRDGQDLLLLHANGTDKVTVSGYFYGTDYRLHEVRFANGTIWTHDTIRALVAIGTDEDETLQGDDGVDVLDGKGGADSLYGGGGGDTLKGGSGEDYLQGDAGNDTLDGGADADTLAGGEDNDTLKGGDGEDYLYGEAGNDSLNGGTGTDTLDGGAGSDTYRFEAGWGHDTINNFSWLRQAGDQDIIVFATGIAQADISARRDGQDLLLLHANGTDKVTVSGYFYGTDYRLHEVRFANGTIWTHDTIRALVAIGTDEDETLQGDDGVDVLDGKGGADSLYGGGGGDTLKGGSGEDYLQGDAGNDTLDGGADADTLAGGDDNDTLKGGDGEDYLYGENGNDSLNGGTGTDTLDGGAGSDTYRFEAGWGHDTINNYMWNRPAGDQDVIVFATGIAQADISARRDGYDLVLLHANGTDKVTVSGYFYGTDYRLHEVRFANGNVWTHETILTLLNGGTEEDDELFGGSGDDTISGKGGSDTLYGEGGNDTLDGGLGVDQLYGGLGDDTFIISQPGDKAFEAQDEGIDTVLSSISYNLSGQYIENLTLTGTGNINATGNSANNLLTGNAGNNKLAGGTGADTVNWSAATSALTITLDANGDGTVTGTGIGTDTFTGIENVIGGSGADTITGNAQNNKLDGGLGIDQMYGGAGNDTYYVNETGDKAFELDGAGTDTVVSSISYNMGGQYVDNVTLVGTQNRTVTGNSQNNVFVGNVGNNTFIGNGGADTVSFAAATSALTITLDATGAGSVTGTGIGTDTFSTIENIIGGTLGDTITGNASVNKLDGGLGNDWIDGGLGADKLYGGLGDDTFIVDDSADKVYEAINEGLDTVRSSATFSLAGQYVENLILTGTGAINATGNGLDNVLTGNAANNILAGGSGNDTASFAAATSALTITLSATGGGAVTGTGIGTDTFSSIENIIGGSANDTITGNGFANRLDGGLGNDTMTGGLGDDVYMVNSTTDKVFEANNEGTDTVYASVSFTTSGQYIENVVLTGTGASKATGNSLNNILTGNGASNILIGGTGLDTFVFNSALNGTTNVDSITDFSAVADTIRLERSVFTAFASVGAIGIEQFQNLNLGAADADDRILYNQTTGDLFYDADGNGSEAAIKFANLANHAVITNEDFLIA